MPAPLEIRILNVDPNGWTPVDVPFDCSSMAVKNTSESVTVRMRTDAQDGGTEDLLYAGKEQTFAVPFHRYRFVTGSQPLWLRSSDVSAPVVLKFLA